MILNKSKQCSDSYEAMQISSLIGRPIYKIHAACRSLSEDVLWLSDFISPWCGVIKQTKIPKKLCMEQTTINKMKYFALFSKILMKMVMQQMKIDFVLAQCGSTFQFIIHFSAKPSASMLYGNLWALLPAFGSDQPKHWDFCKKFTKACSSQLFAGLGAHKKPVKRGGNMKTFASLKSMKVKCMGGLTLILKPIAAEGCCRLMWKVLANSPL